MSCGLAAAGLALADAGDGVGGLQLVERREPHVRGGNPGGAFDHETTTKWMRYFVTEGLKRTKAQGGGLEGNVGPQDAGGAQGRQAALRADHSSLRQTSSRWLLPGEAGE